MNARLLRISAWGAVALGAIHCLATPLVLGGAFGRLPGPELRTFLYMFLGVGVSLVVCGLLLLQLPDDPSPVAPSLRRLLAGYLVLLGVGAVVAMADNPFAWLMLLDASLALPALRKAPRGA